MRFLNKIRFAFRNIGNREKFESDLNEEIADFLERDAQEKHKRGMTRESAERAARVEMRGVDQTKERVRELRPGVWPRNLLAGY